MAEDLKPVDHARFVIESAKWTKVGKNSFLITSKSLSVTEIAVGLNYIGIDPELDNGEIKVSGIIKLERAKKAGKNFVGTSYFKDPGSSQNKEIFGR